VRRDALLRVIDARTTGRIPMPYISVSKENSKDIDLYYKD